MDTECLCMAKLNIVDVHLSHTSLTHTHITHSHTVITPSHTHITHLTHILTHTHPHTQVYSSNIGTHKGQLTFPLQQKLAACTLLCMVKGRQRKESTLGKLYDAYVKVLGTHVTSSVAIVTCFLVSNNYKLCLVCILVIY